MKAALQLLPVFFSPTSCNLVPHLVMERHHLQTRMSRSRDGLLRVTRLFGGRAESLGCDEVCPLRCPLPRNAHSPPSSWLHHSSMMLVLENCPGECIAYTNDLVIWILFSFLNSRSYTLIIKNHWSCTTVLTFSLMSL